MRKYLLFAICCLPPAFAAPAAYVSPGSAIDNVQNYSSNPFWSIEGPYNQRVIPSSVYVKGPSVGAAECQTVVNSAIWTQCGFRNNCQSVSLPDIRPAVILELSSYPGANYADACQGYIDAAFSQYKQQNAAAVQPSSFPAATKPANYGAGAQLENPYAYWNQVPQWEIDEKARQYQLENMQRMNGEPARLTPEAMPETFADLSFVDRMNYLREGWQDPSVGKSSYQQITNLENDQRMHERRASEAQAQQQAAAAQAELKRYQDKQKVGMTDEAGKVIYSMDNYCADHPSDADCQAIAQQRVNEMQAAAALEAAKNGTIGTANGVAPSTSGTASTGAATAGMTTGTTPPVGGVGQQVGTISGQRRGEVVRITVK